MYKTIFAVRNGVIDSCMTVEWPTVTIDTVKELAKLRREEVNDTFKACVPPEVIEFISNSQMLDMRARFNMMEVYNIDTEFKPTDEFLLAYHAAQMQKKDRRKPRNTSKPTKGNK